MNRTPNEQGRFLAQATFANQLDEMSDSAWVKDALTCYLEDGDFEEKDWDVVFEGFQGEMVKLMEAIFEQEESLLDLLDSNEEEG